jgi:hypothetical protein
MINDISNQNGIEYLSELMEAGADLNTDPNVGSRALYRAFLADIEAIAEAARRMFPAVEPPDEVWEHIESVIIKESKN